MNGVLINLTSENLVFLSEEKEIVIPANTDFVTPTREKIYTTLPLSATVSSKLEDKDIHFLQASTWFNTTYNKVQRSEQNIILNVTLQSPYIKYPFTQEQVDKINEISRGRTRLFLLTDEDAKYWSSGNFKENPFRNYRLFVVENKKLKEYPIPTTYLDTVVGTMSLLSKKIGLI